MVVDRRFIQRLLGEIEDHVALLEITGSLGEFSLFDETFGYYADGNLSAGHSVSGSMESPDETSPACCCGQDRINLSLEVIQARLVELQRLKKAEQEPLTSG